MISRVGFVAPDLSVTLNADKSNVGKFFVADVRGGKSFLQNDAGYPMNDIDAIFRQQDSMIRESMIKNLEEVPTTGSPADVPNTEILLGLRSRYLQTPSEMVSWYEKQLEIADARNSLNVVKSDDAPVIDFKGSESVVEES